MIHVKAVLLGVPLVAAFLSLLVAVFVGLETLGLGWIWTAWSAIGMLGLAYFLGRILLEKGGRG